MVANPLDKKLRRRRRMSVLLVVFLFLVIAYGFFCTRMADKFLSPTRWSIVRPAGIIDLTVPTQFGPSPSWATPNWHEARVVFVMAHGYGGSRADWETLMPALARRGYGAVALSMNGQDESPDKTVGFGPKEARTIIDCVNWIRTERGDRPRIILFGISMGGAACWLASELDPSVDAIVTEGAFANFLKAREDWLNRAPGGSIYLAPAVWLAESRAGLNPGSIMPVEAARKWRGRPALLVQAENDRTVPRHHAIELQEASGAPLWIVPGAKHAHCSTVDLDGYLKRLDEVVAEVEQG